MSYPRSVFINCPFDAGYVPIFHAMTFAICYLKHIPRTALEKSDSGEMRINRICKLIRACGHSVHDLSRVEGLSSTGATHVLSSKESSDIFKAIAGPLPRFNMPFEYGLCYGAKRFGELKQKRKRLLVLDSIPHRPGATLSDTAGCDPMIHDNNPQKAVGCIRRFLSYDGRISMPGEAHIVMQYELFKEQLNAKLANRLIDKEELQKLSYWSDFLRFTQEWVRKNQNDQLELHRNTRSTRR